MKLRFTIRDLFWLVLVAALAVGWWIDHLRLDEQLGRLRVTNVPNRRPKYRNDRCEKISPSASSQTQEAHSRVPLPTAARLQECPHLRKKREPKLASSARSSPCAPHRL